MSGLWKNCYFCLTHLHTGTGTTNTFAESHYLPHAGEPLTRFTLFKLRRQLENRDWTKHASPSMVGSSVPAADGLRARKG